MFIVFISFLHAVTHCGSFFSWIFLLLLCTDNLYSFSSSGASQLCKLPASQNLHLLLPIHVFVTWPGGCVLVVCLCCTGLPWWLNPPAVQETWFLSLGQKMPWRRKWQPTPVFLPGKSHGQRSLVGYSRLGWKRVKHDNNKGGVEISKTST